MKHNIRRETARISRQELCRVSRGISDNAMPAQKPQVGGTCRHNCEMRLGKTESKSTADVGVVWSKATATAAVLRQTLLIRSAVSSPLKFQREFLIIHIYNHVFQDNFPLIEAYKLQHLRSTKRTHFHWTYRQDSLIKKMVFLSVITFINKCKKYNALGSIRASRVLHKDMF